MFLSFLLATMLKLTIINGIGATDMFLSGDVYTGPGCTQCDPTDDTGNVDKIAYDPQKSPDLNRRPLTRNETILKWIITIL